MHLLALPASASNAENQATSITASARETTAQTRARLDAELAQARNPILPPGPLEEKLADDAYTSRVYDGCNEPWDSPEYHFHRERRRADQRRLNQQLRDDLEAEHGTASQRKASDFWLACWDEGQGVPSYVAAVYAKWVHFLKP